MLETSNLVWRPRNKRNIFTVNISDIQKEEREGFLISAPQGRIF